MPAILDALRKADAVVLVSPVYFFDMTAQLKLAIDRTFALLEVDDDSGEFKVGSPIKKAALLMTCGDNSEDAASGAVLAFRNICSYSKWEDAGVIIATGLYTPGEIDGRPELDKARALGQEI
jgi:multimeric flavodoxin WrbA